MALNRVRLEKLQRSDSVRSTIEEMRLLGNIIHNPGILEEYNGSLSVSDFASKDNKLMFLLLEKYRSYHSDEKIDCERFKHFCSELTLAGELPFENERSVKIWEQVEEFEKMGSKQPADNKAFQMVKKYSFLRSLKAKGMNVSDLFTVDELEELTLNEVISAVYERLEQAAEGASVFEREDFNGNMVERALKFFEKPEIGLQTPFDFVNEYMHGLCPNDLTLIGGLSNSGKGRFLMNLLVWLIAKEGQRVCLLSNEMTSDDMFKALVCTVVNNPELHGRDLKITQTEIVQARFRNESGEYIERDVDETGGAFHERVRVNSIACREYEEILQWWQGNFGDKLSFVNVIDDYSTPRLRQEIRKARAAGCTVVAYDTLKGYQSSDWEALVQAATGFSELIKSDKSGMIGLSTFQLTDDVRSSKPEDLDSTKIARAKGIMHLADNVLMFMPLNSKLKEEYYVCQLNENGEIENVGDIGQDCSVAAFRIVKNRRGGGKDKIYAVQNNLDLNRWEFIGLLERVGA